MEDILFHKTQSNRLKSAFSFSLITIILLYFMYDTLEKEKYVYATILSVLIIASIISLIKLILNKPTVVIDKNGISNNTNMMGLVKWSFIKEIRIKQIVKREFIIIKLHNENEFLKSKNFISRSLMKSNIKKLESPIVISEFEFDKPLEDVLVKIIEYKEYVNSIS